MTTARSGGRRGPKASLTLPQIAQRALEMVDEHGLDGLTMKRLATALGVGEMTLYGYVRTKDEIYDAITDLAYDALELPTDGDDQLRQLFINLHQLLISHPAVAYLDSARPTTGPGALRIADCGLRLLKEAGLDDDAAFLAERALVNYTVGTTLFQISRTNPANEAALRQRHAAAQAAAPDYPHLAPYSAAYTTEVSPAQLQHEFEYGLDSLIRGICS